MLFYTASSLKKALHTAIENRNIYCKTLVNLSCPAPSYALHGSCWCCQRSDLSGCTCKEMCKAGKCIHRLEIMFPDMSLPLICLNVRYKIPTKYMWKYGSNEGFIPKDDSGLHFLIMNRIISPQDLVEMSLL